MRKDLIQMTSNLGSVFEVKFPTAFTSREEVNGMRQEYINGRSNAARYKSRLNKAVKALG